MITTKLKYLAWPNSKTEEIFSSLVICTLNRPAAVHLLLERIAMLVYVPQEIFIIDGSNNAETLNEVENFFKANKILSNVYYVFSPKGLVIQRNVGIDICKGKILHFLDDDCLPEFDYFLKVEELFSNDTEVGGVTGNIINEFSTPLPLKYKIRRFLGLCDKDSLAGIFYCNGTSVPKQVLGAVLDRDYNVDVVAGASMSFSKSVLTEVGGFSEFFKDYLQSEEVELSLRVRKRKKIIMSFEAKCVHYGDSNSRPNLFKRGFMEVYNKYYVWKLHVLNPSMNCKMQFWGDVIFLYFYSFVMFLTRGFKLEYFKHMIGLLFGTLKAMSTKRVKEIERTIFFEI
jgi:glycosyltransferase involved in cell wall biosynthesis